MTTKEFTFDNGKIGPKSAISRIDKFVVSHELDARGRRIEVTTSVRKFSYHSPLVLTIWGQLVVPDRTNHYFDSSLLGDEESRVTMLLAWEGDSPKPTEDLEWAPWLEAATGRVMRYNA
jgi:hypothetical protein